MEKSDLGWHNILKRPQEGGSGAPVGSIRWFPHNDVVEGWLDLDGSYLSISSYPELFSVLGTKYGGDGVIDFGLPLVSGLFTKHADDESDTYYGPLVMPPSNPFSATVNSTNNHRHQVSLDTSVGEITNPTSGRSMVRVLTIHPLFTNASFTYFLSSVTNNPGQGPTSSSGGHSHGIIEVWQGGGVETRYKNIAMSLRIKYE